MNQKTENQDITSKQQDFSPEDLLSGQVVVDEISIEQMNQVQKFLEDKYSPKIDAIIKDFDDEENSHLSRTYLERRTPLQFHMSVEQKSLLFYIRFNDTDHDSYSDTPSNKVNEVVVTFSDGVTSRNAYGTKQYDHIQRKRKIKYIAKLEGTINEILDRIVEITSKARVTRLENKKRFERMDARKTLDALEIELKSVQAFEKKYDRSFSDGASDDFTAIEAGIETKIDAEKARLKEVGLL